MGQIYYFSIQSFPQKDIRQILSWIFTGNLKQLLNTNFLAWNLQKWVDAQD